MTMQKDTPRRPDVRDRSDMPDELPLFGAGEPRVMESAIEKIEKARRLNVR